jgi:hypothetical protein
MTTSAETRTRTKSLPEIQLAALFPGNADWESTTKQMFQKWKEQVDTSFKCDGDENLAAHRGDGDPRS